MIFQAYLVSFSGAFIYCFLGLELMPYADGTMATFKSDRSVVYISTPDTPLDLFPLLKHKLVTLGLSRDLSEHLINIAKQGK